MMEYDQFFAMNTDVMVAAEGSKRDLAAGFERVRRVVAEAEQRFSRFRETSELSALNRRAGRWVEVSEDMFTLLQAALEVYQLTDGLFDPTILHYLKAVGYDRSMDEIRQMAFVPGHAAETPDFGGFGTVELDADRRAVWMPPGMQIDLGGIAKGWIAAQAAKALAAYTDAGAVNAGGDMALFGLPAGESFWEIALEDPRDDNEVVGVLQVGPGAVATSSVTKRRWLQDEQKRHHIIDPRTGLPSDSPWLSVTVVAEKAAHAEAFAKALLIAGPNDRWRLIERIPDLQMAAIQQDGRVFGNLDIKEILHVPASIY